MSGTIGRAAVAALAVALLSAGAAAAMHQAGDGFVRVFCPSTSAEPHPARIELRHTIHTDRTEGFRAEQLFMIYEPDGEARTNERMRVRVRLFKATGAELDLGRLRARRNVHGEIEAIRNISPTVMEAGDVLQWTVRFRNFQGFDGCLALFGAAFEDVGFE